MISSDIRRISRFFFFFTSKVKHLSIVKGFLRPIK
uniref:Uncharacterized protein n=1 Tax=Parascaris univalens TaxID=6257 RepID=A0A915A3G5_PARUN